MNVCVFCGSSMGTDSIYSKAAQELGLQLALHGHKLVYGGGNIGLMGIIADSVLENSGEVIGIIPRFLLEKEVGHTRLTRLEVVNTMHERKMRMAQLSDAIITMPGGWGTLDETAEILTWKQLGLINLPFGILNTNGFFNMLIKQMNHMVEEGFLKPSNLDFVKVSDSPKDLLQLLELTEG